MLAGKINVNQFNGTVIPCALFAMRCRHLHPAVYIYVQDVGQTGTDVFSTAAQYNTRIAGDI